MLRRRILRFVALSAVAAAGVAVAVMSLAPPASAYTTDQLTALGYSASVGILSNGCEQWLVSGYGSSADLGSNCDSGFQGRLDAFVNATCPCAHQAASTTPAASTTTAPTTTSTTTTAPPATTTTAPPATTTTAAAGPTSPPPPADTSSSPATTTASTTAAAAPALSPVEQQLSDQLAALSAQLAALTDRVSRLEKASDAAWVAFEQAIVDGQDIAAAADIARGTYLNAVYGLGAFAP